MYLAITASTSANCVCCIDLLFRSAFFCRRATRGVRLWVPREHPWTAYSSSNKRICEWYWRTGTEVQTVVWSHLRVPHIFHPLEFPPNHVCHTSSPFNFSLTMSHNVLFILSILWSSELTPRISDGDLRSFLTGKENVDNIIYGPLKCTKVILIGLDQYVAEVEVWVCLSFSRLRFISKNLSEYKWNEVYGKEYSRKIIEY